MSQLQLSDANPRNSNRILEIIGHGHFKRCVSLEFVRKSPDLSPMTTSPPKPPPLPLGKSERTGRLLFFGCLAGLVAWLIFWPLPPAVPKPALCVFHSATGLPCAFCGGTRAVRSLVAGDWERAIYLNPLAVAVVLVGGPLFLLLAVEALRGRRFLPPFNNTLRVVLLATGVVVILPWTIWHATTALKTPKPELVNFEHPIVKFFLRE